MKNPGAGQEDKGRSNGMSDRSADTVMQQMIFFNATGIGLNISPIFLITYRSN